jgi:hypothetical protein
MQEAVMNWGRLLIASGGSYKPPKCFYHLISFSWSRDGKWKYEENHLKPEFEMVVPMPDGSTAVIDYRSRRPRKLWVCTPVWMATRMER